MNESGEGEKCEHHEASQQVKLDDQGEVRDVADPMIIMPASWYIVAKSGVLLVGVVLNHLLVRKKVKARAETKC